MLDTEAAAPPVDASDDAPSGDTPKEMGYTGEFSLTVTKRLEMVKALNKGENGTNVENIAMGDSKAGEPGPKPSGPQPEPIENQFNSSMTATLKALNTPVSRDAARRTCARLRHA